MKRFFPILLSVMLLCLVCLTGCQQTDGPSQDAENPPNDPVSTEIPDQDSAEEALASIPVLYCNFADKSISTGVWDLSRNELDISEGSAVGTTEDPYTLYSLRWDGDKTISGLQVYVEELNHFDTTMTLQAKNYGEFTKDGVSIAVSDDGGLTLSLDGKGRSVSGADINIAGIGEVTPAMMSGNALVVENGTAYYLQSIMAADGVYFVCSAIDLSSMDAESYVLNDKPYSYDEIDMASFGEDSFAEENGVIYFYTKGAVYAFTPKAETVSQILALEDLNLPADGSGARFQFSGVNAYAGHIIAECAKYVTDIPEGSTSFLCSTDGDVLQQLEWDCSEELLIFPKS